MSTAERLRAHGLHPKKRLGQNFLTDARVAAAIAEAAVPSGGTVLEIGPGLGALTRPLLERATRVVAVEKDPDLVSVLREDFAVEIAAGQLDLVEGDATSLDWAGLLAGGPRPHAVAGNLPYLVTGRFLETAAHLSGVLDRAVFMVQAEVADRLLAKPGTKAYGALGVFTQAAFDVRRLLVVRAGAFHPRPNVDSAVVVLRPLVPRRANETEAFRLAVRAAFAQRRKTLRNAWRDLYGWSPDQLASRAAEARISLDARGETLAVEDFARLAALAPTPSRARP